MTQIELAKKSIVSPEMKIVIQQENISEEKLLQNLADGTVVIPANTFQIGAAYTGALSFIRNTNFNVTGYPGAVGVTLTTEDMTALAGTNYQVLPGDRVFIAEDKMIALSNLIARVTKPVEQLLGTVGLASSTTRGIQTLGRGYNRTRSGN